MWVYKALYHNATHGLQYGGLADKGLFSLI
jgi:hypothetical protein